MGVNSLPKTVTRQRRYCNLNRGPSVPESSTLTTRPPCWSTYLLTRLARVICDSWYLYVKRVHNCDCNATAMQLRRPCDDRATCWAFRNTADCRFLSQITWPDYVRKFWYFYINCATVLRLGRECVLSKGHWWQVGLDRLHTNWHAHLYVGLTFASLAISISFIFNYSAGILRTGSRTGYCCCTYAIYL